MSRIIGSRNRPDHQKVEDAFADLSIVDQAKCLAACGALHRWKVGMETASPKLVPPVQAELPALEPA